MLVKMGGAYPNPVLRLYNLIVMLYACVCLCKIRMQIVKHKYDNKCVCLRENTLTTIQCNLVKFDFKLLFMLNF